VSVVDIVVVLLVMVLGLRGLRRGFLREVFSFAGWLGGAIAAVWFMFDLAPLLAESFRIPAAVAGLIAFVGVFVLVSTAFWLLGWLLSGLVRVTVILRPLDKLAGLVLGGAEGIALAAILAFVFGQSPLFPGLHERIEASPVSGPLAERAGALFRELRDDAALKDERAEAEASRGPKPRAGKTPTPLREPR
jgi:membrane protein required for colicin V production